jgi:hypothetical protein
MGRVDTFFGSYACEDCEEYSLEELSNQIDRAEEITEDELEIYDIIQQIVSLNFRLWLIASWLTKIFFLLFTIGLIFAGVYYVYRFLNDIANKI